MKTEEPLATRMRQATSRTVDAAKLDQETRSLRSTYLELGDLLGSTAGALDEDALVAAVLKDFPKPPMHAVTDWSRWIGVLTMAASTILLVVLASSHFGTQTTNPVAQASPHEQSAPDDQALAWDDNWDESVSELEFSTVSLLLSGDHNSRYLGQELDRLESELSDDAAM